MFLFLHSTQYNENCESRKDNLSMVLSDNAPVRG